MVPVAGFTLSEAKYSFSAFVLLTDLLPNVFLALPTMNAVDERNNAITAVIANGFKCNFLFFISYFYISNDSK